MNPIRVVSIAIGLVALIGVLAIALMGDRFSGEAKPTAEQVAAAAIAEGAKEGAKNVAVADQPEAEDPWAVDDSWSDDSAEESDDGDEPRAEAPAPTVFVAPVQQPPSSTSDGPKPVAVLLQ